MSLDLLGAVWGKRLYPSQIPIDTFIDFFRCWRTYPSLKKQAPVHPLYDKNNNLFERFIIFESYLPTSFWNYQSQNFSYLIQKREDFLASFNKYLKEHSTLLNSISTSDDDESLSARNLISTLDFFRSLNVSKSKDIAAGAKQREQWWAQWIPTYHDQIFMQELRYEVSASKGFALNSFSRNFHARAGEIFFQLLMKCNPEIRDKISESLTALYITDKSVYAEIFKITKELSNFLFDNKEGQIFLKEIIKPVIFESLLKIRKSEHDEILSDEDMKLGQFPKLENAEQELVDRLGNDFLNILQMKASIEYITEVASKYMVFSLIQYKYWRSKVQIKEKKFKPSFFVTFRGKESLKPLRKLSQQTLHSNNILVREAFETSHESLKKHDTKGFKAADRAFSKDYLPYANVRGKSLGFIYPKTGRHQHYNGSEELLSILTHAVFDKSTSLVPLNEYLELLYDRYGLIFDYYHLTKSEFAHLYPGDATLFEDNINLLVDVLKNLGLIIESSDSGIYVRNPNE